MFMGNTPPRSSYASSRSIRSGCLESHDEQIQKTMFQKLSVGDNSGEHVGQGSSETRRSSKKACTILATNGRALSCLLKCAMWSVLAGKQDLGL